MDEIFAGDPGIVGRIAAELDNVIDVLDYPLPEDLE